jgi:hypothetical protein
MVADPGSTDGYVIRFLIDRQGVRAWYLYLTSRGEHSVLVGDPWPDCLITSDAPEYLPADMTEERQSRTGVEGELEVCAFSFEAFLYRFWLENILWYKLVGGTMQKPLIEEEERYLQYYHPTKNEK